MRHQTREFTQRFLDAHKVLPEMKVLEVGSLDVNGIITDLFPAGTFTGVDMREGSNVDVVMNGHDLVSKFGEEAFDVVACFDTLEHDDKFWLTVEQMRKVLKKGGWMLIGVPGRNCPAHDHPSDYWRFMFGAFNVFFEGFSDVVVEPENDDEVYGRGQK